MTVLYIYMDITAAKVGKYRNKNKEYSTVMSVMMVCFTQRFLLPEILEKLPQLYLLCR